MAILRSEQGFSKTEGGEVFLLLVKIEGSFTCVIKSVGM